MLRFTCPSCQQPLKCAEDKAGKSSSCPGCKRPITVPFMSNAPLEVIERTTPSPVAPSAVNAWDVTGDKISDDVRITTDRCRKCGTVSEFPPSAAGKIGECAECGEPILVPTVRQHEYRLKTRAERKKGLWWGVLGVMLLLLQVGRCTYNEIRSPETLARVYVRSVLKSPSQAKFISTRVVKSDEHGTHVEVVFEAPNSFGATVRDTMIVTVQDDGTVIP